MRILKILITFFIVILFSCDNKKTENQRFLRNEIHSKEAIDDIKAMEKALFIMRKRGCDDPLSWYYQGAIHYVPDTVLNNQFCDGYHNLSDSKLGWRNCTHTPSKQEEIHFLVWHRIYIWHFEKIVRKLSGKKDFALPYWDYTSGDKEKMSLQSNFRNTKSSLYESCRFDSINHGFKIEGEVERALDITKLMTYTDYQLFNKNMDRAPHGTIHDYIGHGNDYNDGKLIFDNPITGKKSHDGLMGWVPTAGFDPIFWTHHANIDRIWQMWTNSKNGQMVTLEQLKSVDWPYVFFDEYGKEVRYSPEQVYKILYTMDYDYDDTKLLSKDINIVKSKPTYIINKCESKKILSGKNTEVILDRTLGQHRVFDGSIIEIEASYKEVPSGVYEVYLNTHQRSTKSNSFVGFMTFFGEDHKKPGKSCKDGCCKAVTYDGRTKIVFTFQHSMQEDWNFYFYNHNGYSTGDLRIDKIIIRTN